MTGGRQVPVKAITANSSKKSEENKLRWGGHVKQELVCLVYHYHRTARYKKITINEKAGKFKCYAHQLWHMDHHRVAVHRVAFIACKVFDRKSEHDCIVFNKAFF